MSNVTGNWIKDEEATDPLYWAKHLCAPVRFADGVGELLRGDDRILLEVGPGQTLISIVKQHTGYRDEESPVLIPLLPASYLKQSDSATLLLALGKLWQAGVEIDWSRFYAYERRHRLPLPTYPFERQRYWLGDGGTGSASLDRQEATCKKADPANWFYQPVWKETAWPMVSLEDSGAKESPCWLIFVDRCSVGAEVVKRLVKFKGEINCVVSVEVGKHFDRLGERNYTINPADPDDYHRLVEELIRSGTIPTTVIHFWSVTQTSEQSFDRLQKLGFYSLVFLARALGRSGVVSPMEIKVVSNDLQEVSGEENLRPEKSTLLGACKVIPQEYPQITCRSIDIVLPQSNKLSKVRLVEKLLIELTADSCDLVVAYRGTRRWVQSFEPIRLELPARDPKRLRKEGIYLITGGLGGIGLVLAETLTRQVRAKLVLTGRTGLPAREEWQAWLSAHANHDLVARKIRKILELEELGAEILVMNADVADMQQMRKVIERTIKRFGDLHGVIHGAGIVSTDSFSMIQDLKKSECERHFDAKARGLYVLHTLLHERKLDFVFLLSSLSAVLGGLGFASYAAANIFMDNFARKRNQTSKAPWISVNWDTWRVREEAAQQLMDRGLEATVAKFQMAPDEGAAAFLRVLSTEAVTHLVNSTGDLQARIKRWIDLTSVHEVTAVEKAAPSSLHQRPNLATPFVGPTSQDEKLLAEIWRQLLGLQQVGIHDNFFELGGDSILGIQITARANRAGFRLTAKHLFEHQTIAELAAAAACEVGKPAPTQASRVAARRSRSAGLAPSDFPLAKLDLQRLSKISALIEELEESEEAYAG